MYGSNSYGDIISTLIILGLWYVLDAYTDLSNQVITMIMISVIIAFIVFLYATSIQRHPKRTKLTSDIRKAVYETHLEIKNYYSVRSLIHKLDTDIPYEFNKDNKSFRSFKIEAILNNVHFTYHEEFLIRNNSFRTKPLFKGIVMEFDCTKTHDYEIFKNKEDIIVFDNDKVRFYVSGKRFLGEILEPSELQGNINLMIKEIERLLIKKQEIELKHLEERK